MSPEEWWKNFALNIELDVAGTFIYNGAKALHNLEVFNYAVDTFEILYSFSVGIERLLKIAIILIEHDDSVVINEFEKSLITHSTIELYNRVKKQKKFGANFSAMHVEFLALLSNFYKSQRYGRYTFSSVPNIEQEKVVFIKYIEEHLNLTFDKDSIYSIENTDQIRKFVGRIVKSISTNVFDVIKKEASRLNIYTSELRGDSKAIKVFYGDRLDFIDEKIKKKEIILFLMNHDSKGEHIDLLRSYDALDLDPQLVSEYIKALINDNQLPFVGDEIDELYTEVTNVKERLQFIQVMDSQYLCYKNDEEDVSSN